MPQATFPDDVRSAQAARSFVRNQIAGCSESTVEAVVLVVSELVTNAVLHARSPVSVEVRRCSRGGVHVEVSDSSSATPVRTPPSDTALSGRGVALVEAVSTRWGVRSRTSGKTVWFEVDPDD